MCGADVASRKEKIFDICGIKHAVGDPVRRGSGVKRGCGVIRRSFESGGIVVVHRPAAVCDGVRKLSACLYIALCERVGTYISARFAFAGQKSYPFKLPVFGMVIAVVLYVIPYAEGDLEKLVTYPFGIVERVVFTAKLYPPEVSLGGAEFMCARAA